MSVIVSGWAWHSRPPGIGGSELLVLLALADRADDTGRKCWPGQTHLAEKLGASTRTVRRGLQNLEDRGVIGKVQRGGQTNTYTIRMDLDANGKPIPCPLRTRQPCRLHKSSVTPRPTMDKAARVRLNTSSVSSSIGQPCPSQEDNRVSTKRTTLSADTSDTSGDTSGDTSDQPYFDDMKLLDNIDMRMSGKEMVARLLYDSSNRAEYRDVRELLEDSVNTALSAGRSPDEVWDILSDPSRLKPGDRFATWEAIAVELEPAEFAFGQQNA